MGSVATGAIDLTKPEKFSPSSKFMELVEYDPQTSTMEITFKSGSKYRYFRVFPVTFLSFKQSPTHDAYYARAVKGNLMSAKLIDHGIGRERSTPLKKQHKEKPLDPGLKRQQSREQRISGTVARALSAI